MSEQRIPRIRRRVSVAGRGVFVLMAAGVLGACGSSPAPTIIASTNADSLKGQVCCVLSAVDAPTQVDGISTTYNGWDTALITWMVPHDAVGSQMAALAATQAGSQGVKDVAAEIDSSTSTKYLTMSKLATAWGQPVPSTDPAAAAGHDHGGGLDESATAKTLIPLQGRDFDREFLKIMIAHHQAALPIAQATIDNGDNPQAKALAQQVIDTQTAEIATMQQLESSLA